MIKNVLVAVDGSENSLKALDFGLDLAEKYGAAVEVLNVSELPVLGVVPQTMIFPTESPPVFIKDLSRLHEEILERAVSHAISFKPNVKVSKKLRDGNPASEVVAEAKEGSFDVVVVAHKGLGRVREALLGGVCEKVVHTASCPVIIVR